MKHFGLTTSFVAGSVLWMFPVIFLAAEPPARSLIGALSSDRFKDREQAELDLGRWADRQPERGIKSLLLEFEGAKDPEIRRRVRGLLRRIVVEEHQKSGMGYVGIRMVSVELMVPGDSSVRSGVRILGVEADTPASRAGLRVGDVIVGLDGVVWRGGGAQQSFADEIKRRKPGSEAWISIARDGKVEKILIVVGPRPLSLQEFAAPWSTKDAAVLEERAKDKVFERWLADQDTKKPSR
ncbi:MAG: PDZ domain-containing protein [Verrucomicrobia bacterium]|nr:MAG: PDZ domain-containing protein [Verrucomicrobiota bacterium]